MQIEVKDKYTGKNIKEPNSEIPDSPKSEEKPATRRRRKMPVGFIILVAAIVGVAAGLIFAVTTLTKKSELIGTWVMQQEVHNTAGSSESAEPSDDIDMPESSDPSEPSESREFFKSVKPSESSDGDYYNWTYEFNEDGSGSYGLGFGTPRTFHYEDKKDHIQITWDKQNNIDNYSYHFDGDKLIIKDNFGENTYEKRK